MFDVVENQLLAVDTSNLTVCLMGNFNARSKQLNDFLHINDIDHHIIELMDEDAEIFSNGNDIEAILNLDKIPVKQISPDVYFNKYCKRLVICVPT